MFPIAPLLIKYGPAAYKVLKAAVIIIPHILVIYSSVAKPDPKEDPSSKDLK